MGKAPPLHVRQVIVSQVLIEGVFFFFRAQLSEACCYSMDYPNH